MKYDIPAYICQLLDSNQPCQTFLAYTLISKELEKPTPPDMKKLYRDILSTHAGKLETIRKVKEKVKEQLDGLH